MECPISLNCLLVMSSCFLLSFFEEGRSLWSFCFVQSTASEDKALLYYLLTCNGSRSSFCSQRWVSPAYWTPTYSIGLRDEFDPPISCKMSQSPPYNWQQLLFFSLSLSLNKLAILVCQLKWLMHLRTFRGDGAERDSWDSCVNPVTCSTVNLYVLRQALTKKYVTEAACHRGQQLID